MDLDQRLKAINFKMDILVQALIAKSGATDDAYRRLRAGEWCPEVVSEECSSSAPWMQIFELHSEYWCYFDHVTAHVSYCDDEWWYGKLPKAYRAIYASLALTDIPAPLSQALKERLARPPAEQISVPYPTSKIPLPPAEARPGKRVQWSPHLQTMYDENIDDGEQDPWQ